jgi:uncharacterized GH25 family protein
MKAAWLGLLLIPGSAVAHDFWIQPDDYRADPGVSVPLTLQVGHGPARQRSMLQLRRITRFEVAASNGTVTDQRGNLDLGGVTEDGELRFGAPGTYVVILETDNHARTLDGAETYSRHSKALVQIGSSTSEEAVQPVGMALEIVPGVNPYASAATTLPIQVLLDGKPVLRAFVELTDLENDAAPVEAHLTDEQGYSSFKMPGRGKWLLNVVWKTTSETYFSSLSFGR